MNKKTILMIIMIMFSALTFCQSENLPTNDLANLIRGNIKEVIEKAEPNFEEMTFGNINALNEITNLFERLFGKDFTEGEIYQSFPEEIKKIYQYGIAFREKNGDVDNEWVKEFLDFVKGLDFIHGNLSNDEIFTELIIIICFCIFSLIIINKNEIVRHFKDEF